jgi:hypothetical protein
VGLLSIAPRRAVKPVASVPLAPVGA